MNDADRPLAEGRTVHRLDRVQQVRDWLVSPAWHWPCTDLADVLDDAGSPWGSDGRWVLTNGPDVGPLKEKLYARRPLVTAQPLPAIVEGGPIRWLRPTGDADDGQWRRVHTQDDGLVDWSQFCYTPEYRHAVAATVFEVDQAERRVLAVASTGPFALWVGGELVLTRSEFSYMEPIEHHVAVRLPSGTTPVVVATWQVAFREVRHVVRMRVLGLPVRVVIPSPGADEHASTVAEQLLESVASRRWAVDAGVARLEGPRGAAVVVDVAGGSRRQLRLSPDGTPVTLAGSSAPRVSDTPVDGDSTASMLSTGETVLTVRVDDPRCPVYRELRVAQLPERRRAYPVGGPQQWRRELLEHVAETVPSTARLLARYQLDPSVRPAGVDLTPPLAMIESRADCADFEAVGLMHAWHRIPAEAWESGERERVHSALLGFKYWIDQPGLDAMCYFTENHQFVWHTAELLAGEAFANETFGNTGWRGAQHAAHGRENALEWMRRKLEGGFSEFDSNAYLAIDTLALVSLVEFARDKVVRQHAEALLDKILFTLATNSWRGIHGAAHGRTYTQTLRSSRFEETAPIMWLLWGTGALNSAVLPATALATARRYVVPDVVRAVATELPEEWYGRQVYRGRYRFFHDLLERPYESDLRIWRTPDAMLASTQDYRHGLPGLQEHIWGATLGSETQVFATYPAASATGSSARPNAWAGQRILPRVRQHRDSLLALHGLPADDPQAVTHLWFPAAEMDEVVARGCWLAGRVADGYVAVAADGGFRPIRAGDEAYQAWLPKGSPGAYVATIGRKAVDGGFTDFVAALAEPEFEADGAGQPRVRWVNRWGELLQLDFSGAFTVAGMPVDIDADGRPEQPPHLENPAGRVVFGEPVMEMAWGGKRLLLDLVGGRRLEPDSRAAASLAEATDER